MHVKLQTATVEKHASNDNLFIKMAAFSVIQVISRYKWFGEGNWARSCEQDHKNKFSWQFGEGHKSSCPHQNHFYSLNNDGTSLPSGGLHEHCNRRDGSAGVALT